MSNLCLYECCNLYWNDLKEDTDNVEEECAVCGKELLPYLVEKLDE